MAAAVDVYLEESESAISGTSVPTFNFSVYADEQLLANYINALQQKLNSITGCFDAINKSALDTLDNYSNIFNTIQVPDIVEVDLTAKSTNVLGGLNAVVSASGLKLRAGASTSTDVIDIYKEGSQVVITGDEVDGMVPVRTEDGREGWMGKKYLTVTEPEIPEKPVETRETEGQAVVVDPSSGGNIETPEVELRGVAGKTATVDVGHLHLREGDNTKTNSIGIYSKGTQVTLTGKEHDGMVEVVLEDGKTGWMGKKSLNIPEGTQETPAQAVTPQNQTTAGTNLGEQTAQPTPTTKDNGEPKLGGKATVNIDRIHLREGDNTGTESLGIYKKGTEVTLTGNEVDGMVEVRLPDGKSGWMGKKSLNIPEGTKTKEVPAGQINNTHGDTTPKTELPEEHLIPDVDLTNRAATVAVGKLYLREGDNTGTTPIGVYDQGTKVTLTGKEVDGMVEVILSDGKTGWMGKKSLNIEGDK